jgi:two-component system chemotaxis sensor kinase CheA
MNTDDDILAAAREGFLEEARDTLVQFEQALLAVEDDPADAEALNSAFRAAHTLKGGAGLFGYDAVVLFTHEVESVLDLMREGRLPLTPEGMAAAAAEPRPDGPPGGRGAAAPSPTPTPAAAARPWASSCAR